MWLFRELGEHARVVFTDRRGGVSAAPFDSLNLGNNTRDDDDAVRRNLIAVRERASVPPPPDEWVRLEQVHGSVVVDADDTVPVGTRGDASVTSCRDRALVVVSADCAPLALSAGAHLAVVHAGWRGLQAGVIERAVGALRARAGIGTEVNAVLGPCIHREHYEFGATDLDAFAAVLGEGARGVTASGAASLDVPMAVRLALDAVGVARFDDVGVCTFASGDHFSYRRDGETGRQAVVAWMP